MSPLLEDYEDTSNNNNIVVEHLKDTVKEKKEPVLNTNLIVLQASFPLLSKPKVVSFQNNSVDSSSSNNTNASSPSEMKEIERETLNTDDIKRMWSVATKAKYNIPQGYRLENLAWRLWHRCTVSNNDKSIDKNMDFESPLIKTASSILLEIQKDTKDTNKKLILDDDYLINNINLAGNIDITSKEAMSKATKSKRKKNLDRFMQKYQIKLQDITGNDESNTDNKDIITEPVNNTNNPNTNNITDYNQTIKEKMIEKEESSIKLIQIQKESPKPKISLLSKLLDHQHQIQNNHNIMNTNNFYSEELFYNRDNDYSGCSLGQTPPTRPSAPVDQNYHNDAITILENKTGGMDITPKKSSPNINGSSNSEGSGELKLKSVDSNDSDYTSMMLW